MLRRSLAALCATCRHGMLAGTAYHVLLYNSMIVSTLYWREVIWYE